MYFWKQKSLDLRNLIHATKHPHTHQFPALGRPHSFKKYVCNKCVCRFIFSPFKFLWIDSMIPCWWKFYFCSWLWREKPSCLWFRLKSWHCRDFVKTHGSNLACDWPKSFSGMINSVITAVANQWDCRNH